MIDVVNSVSDDVFLNPIFYGIFLVFKITEFQLEIPINFSNGTPILFENYVLYTISP